MTILQDVSLADANPNYSINLGNETVLNTINNEPIVVGSTNYWSLGQNTNIYTLYIQKYNSDGTVNGDAVLLNAEATFDAITFKTASVLENGDIVLVWRAADGNYITQAYAEDGVAASPAVVLDTVAGGALSDGSFQIVSLDDGGYVITSHELTAANIYRVTAQVYDAAGNLTTDAFTITPNAVGSNWSTYDVAAVNGGFVVMVTSDSQDPDGSAGVIGAVYANDGTQLIAEFPANATATGEQWLEDIAALAGGGYAATWKIYDDNTGEYSVQTRVFDAAGNAVGAEFTVTSVSADYYADISETVALSDGTFAVIWAEANVDWDEYTFRAQLYDADGNAIGSVVDLLVTDQADSVNIFESDNGVLTISYTGYTIDGDVEKVVTTAAVYNAPIGLDISADTVAEDAAIGTIVGTLNSTDADGDTIAWALTDDADGKFSLVTQGGVTYVVVNGQIDYETATSYDIGVGATDGTYTTTKTLKIHIGDVFENSAPTDIEISNTEMLESARIGFEVGVLSATDADGDAVTWSLVQGSVANGNHNDYFELRTNSDGSTSVVLKSPLDHESAADGIYHLIIKATDENGGSTTQTIDIAALDDPFKLSSVPTGKDYVGIVESAAVGQEIGYIMAFDDSFTPVSATLVDDADGAFTIKTRVVGTETRYYVVTDKKLNYETADSHSITIRATDADGLTYDKTIDVKVLDAAETGDTPRGRIKIDASTALASDNGGVNWNTYLDAYFEGSAGGLPNMTAEEYLYTFYAMGEEHKMSVKGTDLAYNPNDPVTGEDTHTVSGAITDIIFGEGKTAFGSPITKTELSITGLDLENDSTPLQRIYGEVNAVISAFMHGEDSAYPDQLAQVKAILSSYAQTFEGSSKGDTYTGTIFNDIVRGNSGADVINGGGGNDRIYGGSSADVLKGGAGNDQIYGEAGADKLYGASGADTFHFAAVAHSKKGAFDTIHDFSTKEGDRIDLSDIDANSNKVKDQDFTFIGSQDFHKKAGELHFDKVKGDTVIEGDVNGDGKADFVLHLDDAMTLKADYFLL